ncbi:MAG: DNA-directed RNA polymerase subunit alpha [Candidatus Moraniibacteriota bacterium]|nr:MAG: DNA-directed RNA polymerase subunit alpha [Candidatus Moranbacteria bacterium]
MSKISIPQASQYTEGKENTGMIEIPACFPGYGTTLGNAIRRVLLSSIEGAAITSVKIKGVPHEFSAIDGVMEDVVQIILNLKQVRFRMHSDEKMTATLSVKGEKVVTSGDIKTSADLEIVDGSQHIATLTDKKSALEMEFTVEKGIGYVPSDQNEEEKEVGSIVIDAVYTPVKRVNYNVENMRVGKRTDYEKVTLEIVTDGSITPQEAFDKSVDILVEQFNAISSGGGVSDVTDIETTDVEEVEEENK